MYVPSKDNLADAPSRVLSSSDCMLSSCVWKEIEKRWGPHSIDLMALDSTRQGSRLRHFTPWPTKDSAGVNVFSQTLHHLDNTYMFPPLALVGIVLRFLASQSCPFTIGVPEPSAPSLLVACYLGARSRFCPPRRFGRPRCAFIPHFRWSIPFASFTLGH